MSEQDDTGMSAIRAFVAETTASQKAQYMECPTHGFPFDLDHKTCPFCEEKPRD